MDELAVRRLLGKPAKRMTFDLKQGDGLGLELDRPAQPRMIFTRPLAPMGASSARAAWSCPKGVEGQRISHAAGVVPWRPRPRCVHGHAQHPAGVCCILRRHRPPGPLPRL